MRTILTLILAAIVLYSCEKGNSGPEDEIYLFDINKEVTLFQPDSTIDGICSPILFEINKKDSNEYNATIRLYDTPLSCIVNAGIRLIMNDVGNVAALKQGDVINEKGNWGNATNLKEFAGKGEMYIGIEHSFFPSGITNYHYSWIKIELSEKMDTLHIISRARNLTDNNPIKAGQME